jgi:hypothetical protein
MQILILLIKIVIYFLINIYLQLNTKRISIPETNDFIEFIHKLLIYGSFAIQ